MNQPPRSRPAFTLIELLIVIGIITLLIAISVVVGTKVVSSGKGRVTEGIIKALDMSLTDYIATTGGPPPPTVGDPRAGDHVLPVADALNADPSHPTHINSIGLYLLQCKGVSSADSEIQGLDPKYVRLYDPDQQAANPMNVVPETQPSLVTVFDGWGNPIRYVHPAFKGSFPPPPAQGKDTRELVGDPLPGKTFSITKLRRWGKVPQGASPGNPQPPPDGDAGVPASNRPYFYSVGPDGKAGYEYDPTDPTYRKITTDFNADNVFVSVPRYEK